MNNDSTGYLINLAMKKYPKAKLIALENFTYTADSLDLATSMNLAADARAYKWNSDTVNAIHYVLTNKPRTSLLG
jgi:hypothetical protein